MNINNARYELTAVRPEQYPESILPEIAFAGRSNVGKSSFINALLNRKNLARVGTTPGKTREINFYNIDGRLYFVDLPGYGYANVSKTQRASWGKIIETYLYSRKQLKLIVMLVDIRHKPTSDDKLMYDWILGRKLDKLVVATKTDKISRSHVNNRLKTIKETLGVEGADIIAFSALTKQGSEEVWRFVSSHIPENPS